MFIRQRKRRWKKADRLAGGRVTVYEPFDNIGVCGTTLQDGGGVRLAALSSWYSGRNPGQLSWSMFPTRAARRVGCTRIFARKASDTPPKAGWNAARTGKSEEEVWPTM